MRWFYKRAVVLMIPFLSVGMWISSAQAAVSQHNDLIKMTVHISIENPDYFWKYPFSGRQLDAIRVSGMGQTFFVQTNSGGETFEVNVPKDYKLKLALAFQNNNETVKEFRYATKRGAADGRDTLTIVLKAPEPQPVIFTTRDFEEVRN